MPPSVPSLTQAHSLTFIFLLLAIAPPDWPVQYSKGRLNIDMLRTHLPPPGEDSLALFCGPDAMLDRTVKPGLKVCPIYLCRLLAHLPTFVRLLTGTGMEPRELLGHLLI